MSQIPRHQRILFWVMLGGCILMALYLIRLRERAHDRLAALNDSTPLAAPAEMPAESITLELANDSDGSITPVQQSISLPQEPTIRVRALLDHLLAQYALPQSAHPLAAGSAIDEVFLLPIPGANPDSAAGDRHQMAVINLHSSFVESHPSGVAVETLTLLSIARTLHDNMPTIEQVRFLVDGQQRETLAGHADLTHVYLTSDPAAPSSGDTTGGSQ